MYGSITYGSVNNLLQFSTIRFRTPIERSYLLFYVRIQKYGSENIPLCYGTARYPSYVNDCAAERSIVNILLIFMICF
jgi:hypothetical protein